MKTKLEIYTSSLNKLGVLALGQTAAPEDIQVCDRAYDSLYAQMLIDRVAPWGNSIPDQYAESMAVLVADKASRDFQVPDSIAIGLRNDSVMARADIVKALNTDEDNRSAHVEYY